MLTQQTVTSEEKLKHRLSTISNLPSPPLVFTQITKVINDPKTSVKDISAVMSEDAAMSAKVLRLSNSAFYGARSEITGIRQAILVLGLEAVKSLVLSSSVFDMFKSQKLDTNFQDAFWRHSLATALAGRILIQQHHSLSCYDPEVAFSAGLLHDIGKLIICCFMPADHKQVRQQLQDQRLSDYQAEEYVLGYPHTLIGSTLAQNWKLPASIHEAIEFHHSPSDPTDEDGKYSSVIHVADYLARLTFEEKLPAIEGWSYLQPEIGEYLGLTTEVTDALSQRLLEEYSRSSTFIQMAMSA
ncbi:MAG: HDOD domain-containing protein [Candidatus Zixiibacteriota bacterium]|nr:MAG: HDOD domain-containing protein [candidate division Zixibacteria bacterium]